MLSSRPKSWFRAASRTKNKVFVLVLKKVLFTSLHCFYINIKNFRQTNYTHKPTLTTLIFRTLLIFLKVIARRLHCYFHDSNCSIEHVCGCVDVVVIQVFGVVAVSSMYAVSAPLPAVLAVLPRYSDLVVRAHCSIQALSAAVGVVVFCLVATEPRSACRRVLCAAAVAGEDQPSRRMNHNERPPVLARLFHVEMADTEPAAATPTTPTQDTGTASECLLRRSTADVIAGNNMDAADASETAEAYLAAECLERRQSTTTSFNADAAEPVLPNSQRTRLLVTTANFPDDLLFAHTSV